MAVGNYQEAEFYNASYKNNKEKKLKSQKRGENFSPFLIIYLKKKGKGYLFFKDPP
jgi:hypothetical protein